MMKMRIFVMRTLLIAMGMTGAYHHPSMAQTTGRAEDVLRQVLPALAANDQLTLNKLSIDQSDFKKYVWPGLAAQVSGSSTSADKYYTRSFEDRFNALVKAAEAFARKYNESDGEVWPQKEATALDKALADLQMVPQLKTNKVRAQGH